MRYVHTHIDVLAVLAVAIAVRILLVAAFPTIIIEPDSEGYFRVGRAITSLPTIEHFVNPERTPIYPIITSLLIKYDLSPLDIRSEAFRTDAHTLLFAQMALGILASLLWFKAMLLLAVPRRVALVCGIVCATSITVAYWERSLLTEGVGISWLVIQTYTYLRTLKSPAIKFFVACWLVSVIGLLIRPAFMFAPFVSFLIIGLFHRSPTVWRNIIATLLFIVAVPLLYSYTNLYLHGYSGITYFSDINLLGVIMQNNIPMEPGAVYTNIYNGIQNYYASGGDPYVFRFILHYDPYIFTNIQKLNELQAFVKTIIWTHLDVYIWSSLAAVPKSFAHQTATAVPINGNPLAIGFFQSIDQLVNLVKSATIVIFPIIILHMRDFLRKKTFHDAALLLIGGVAITQIITTAFFVYEADPVYKRMMSPILYHVSSYLICMFYSQLNKKNQLN